MSQTHKRGFASMDPATQRVIAARGGKAAQASGKAHRYTPEQAREAGRKGGLAVSANRAHMSRIGSLGGRKTSQDTAHMSLIGRKGGRVTQGTSTVGEAFPALFGGK